MNAALTPIEPALIERVLIHGDLRQLTPAQKVSYYKAVCESVGLNPLTQPFQYLVLNGKEILYATRAATEQLRQVHAVSVQIMAREVVEDCYVVTARGTLASGRQDENIGAVPIAGLKGEARANAMMKAETKAKRRVTLAICGLGMLDETEVASIPGVAAGYVVEAPARDGIDLPDSGLVPGRRDGGDRGISSTPQSAALVLPADESANHLAPNGGESGLYIARVDMKPTKNANVTKYVVVLSDGREVTTIKTQLGALAEQVCQERTPITVETKDTKWGTDLLALHRVQPEAIGEDHAGPVTADEIPF